MSYDSNRKVMSQEERAQRFPSDLQAEEMFLGAMMWDMPGLWDRFANRIRGELFHPYMTRTIAEALIDMHVSGMAIGTVELTQWLRERDQLDAIGGSARISEIWGRLYGPMVPAHVGYQLEILEGLAIRREMLKKADEMAEAALDYARKPKDVLMEVEQALFEMHNVQSHQGMVHVSELLPAALGEIEQTVNRRGHVTNGVASGFTSLDRMTMGFGPGVHYLAARPSMGKTTVLLQWAMHCAAGFGDYPEYDQEPLGTAIFSCETHNVALAKRGLLNLAGINLQRARDGQMSRAQQEALRQEVRRGGKVGGRLSLIDSKLFIEASYGLTIQDFRARARMLVRKHAIRIMFIDYLQLMRSTSRQAMGSREREIAEISFGLKMTALELEIPIVCLAQLNREGDVPRPKMSHLRESGSVEQDADTVMMLCRAPDRILETLEEDSPFTYLGLDLAKQKDGPTTTDGEPIVLRFDKEFFRLTSVDEKLFSNNDEQRQGHSAGSGEKYGADRPKRPRGRPRKDGSSGPPPYADDGGEFFEG